ARIHAALGVAIEAQYADALDRHLDELARHFAAAGPSAADRALAYALRAGERAAARLAYDEAAGYFATALDLHERSAAHDAAESAALRLRLGDAISATGRWEEARDVFAAAADASRAAGEHELFARAALGH